MVRSLKNNYFSVRTKLDNYGRTVAHTWLLTYDTFDVQLTGEGASIKAIFSLSNTTMFSEEKIKLFRSFHCL